MRGLRGGEKWMGTEEIEKKGGGEGRRGRGARSSPKEGRRGAGL